MVDKVLFSSDSTEWETPDDLFLALDDEFHFTLDAAASHYNTKVSQYYTIDGYFFKGEKRGDHDGLTGSWAGQVVWLNPPYGRDIGKWVSKAIKEAEDGWTIVVMLLPARTDTKWFHSLPNWAEFRFLYGRLKFKGAKSSAPFPSMVVVLNNGEATKLALRG